MNKGKDTGTGVQIGLQIILIIIWVINYVANGPDAMMMKMVMHVSGINAVILVIRKSKSIRRFVIGILEWLTGFTAIMTETLMRVLIMCTIFFVLKDVSFDSFTAKAVGGLFTYWIMLPLINWVKGKLYDIEYPYEQEVEEE